MKINIRGLVFTGFAAAVFAQSASAVSTNDKTVTSKTYVDAYAQAQADRVMSTTVQSSDWQSDEKYPSMKLLSQSGLADAQPKAETLVDSTTNELEQNAAWIGWHSGDNGENADWVKLQGDGYTEIVHTVGKGHLVRLDSNKIADAGSDIAGSGGNGPAPADEDDLTTAKAVYEFVNGDGNGDGGFQPKATADNGAQVGVRTGAGTSASPHNSTWYSLSGGYADPSTGIGQTRYVSVTRTDQTNTVWVDLHNTMLISDTISGAGATAISSQAGEKLATGDSVYDYSVPMNWTERGTAGNFAVANKKLVTDGSGNVILAEDTTANIPSDMPDECDTSTGTHVCALVAYWAAASTDPETGAQIPAGLKYEWTVMAPTGA